MLFTSDYDGPSSFNAYVSLSRRQRIIQKMFLHYQIARRYMPIQHYHSLVFRRNKNK